MVIIEPYKGLRRRPIWEFELSTAISELNLNLVQKIYVHLV